MEKSYKIGSREYVYKKPCLKQVQLVISKLEDFGVDSFADFKSPKVIAIAGKNELFEWILATLLIEKGKKFNKDQICENLKYFDTEEIDIDVPWEVIGHFFVHVLKLPEDFLDFAPQIMTQVQKILARSMKDLAK